MNVLIKTNVLRTLVDLIKNVLILLAATFAKQEVKDSWTPATRGRLNVTQPILCISSTS